MPIAAMAASDAIAATDHNNTVNNSEVRQALRHTPGVLEESSTIKTTSDSDTAINAATAGATVDIPKDASEGVTIGSQNGNSLDITLPNADKSSDATTVANGVVAYNANNGSANAVQAENDGSVRMLTVIDNPNAPTTYDYKISVPNGGHIQLTKDQGAVVLSDNGEVISYVQSPWAKDAKGKKIRTWFTTDGLTLTQHVKHNVRGVTYPVVADPWFWDYLGCILGIGVPIGAALVIYAVPATWPALSALMVSSRTQTNVGKYASWVKDRCTAFIRSR
jgi:hypothetical protein